MKGRHEMFLKAFGQTESRPRNRYDQASHAINVSHMSVCDPRNGIVTPGIPCQSRCAARNVPRGSVFWLLLVTLASVSCLLAAMGTRSAASLDTPTPPTFESGASSATETALSPEPGSVLEPAPWSQPSVESATVNPRTSSVAQDLDGQQVRNAIQRGVRYLLDSRNGSKWRCAMNYEGGGTALVALALLNSGVPAQSAEMQDVLAYLTSLPPKQTYTSSLTIMALTEADPKRYRPHIQKHVDFLVQLQFRGGFGYGVGPTNGDGSNSQFAILGLHAAQSAGIDIDRKVWISAKSYWERNFNRNGGGFGYLPGHRSTGSMSCAGVCSLTIIDQNLNEGTSRAEGNQILCCQRSQADPMIEDGINWLGRNFSVLRNPGGDGHSAAVYYFLYSLERTGRLTGRRFFGEHDWYREGAAQILKNQRLDGSWQGQNAFNEQEKPIATAMALLFLSKGLRPILVGKYRYDDNDWDPHPFGIQYLTRFVESVWERKLNWQTIDAVNASANDLLESPVLHITGKRRLKLTADQIENLKEYVDNGGFLLFESENGFDCPDARLFDQDVRDLLAILFPDAKLEVLKPDHMVWNSQFQLKPDQDFPLLGIQSCCRTSVIYCPSPISGVWQLNKPRSDSYRAEVREKIDYSLKLGTNILAFATGNELKDKLDRPKIDTNANSEYRSIGRKILVPKLRHSSGFDDAPMALGNLLRRVENDRGIQFQHKTEFVDADIDQLAYHPIIFIHGRGRLILSDEEKQALKEHLDRDGFIFGDAICGDESFYQSFKQVMQEIAGGPTWEKIEPTDDLLSREYGGYDLTSVSLKLPQQGVTRTIETPPRLEAIKFEDRYRIIFSQYDISCALENGTSSSCFGYTVEDASKIGTNILLYALQP